MRPCAPQEETHPWLPSVAAPRRRSELVRISCSQFRDSAIPILKPSWRLKMTRIAVLSIAVFATSVAHADEPPKHLGEAQNLVKHLELKYTNYEHGPPNVKWTEPVESHADCSGFVDALFAHAYGYDKDAFKRW